MIGEIIAIGDELTSGRVANTTSSFAARQLFAAGYEILAMQTIGDTPELIGEVIKQAVGRVDFVIVTGGLGATTDDLTNKAVAVALNRPPTLYPEILDIIRHHMGDTDDSASFLEKLAWLPKGAEVLNARARMAGYLLVYEDTPIFFLPGVPSQMEELLVEHVLPCLADWTGNDDRHHVRQRVYRIFGLHENEINQKLRWLEKTPHSKIGYYPVNSEVHVSLTVLGRSEEEADTLFASLDRQITAALGDFIYGLDHDSMASVMGGLLRAGGRKISVAESCTGGLLSSKITWVAGSSEWFTGGVVAYSNDLKEDLLGVDHRLLAAHGAVSAPVARAMAAGIAGRCATGISVSVTGLAGPTGGSAEKPVGTVYIGLSVDGEITDSLFHFSGNRQQIQEKTAQTALDLVRRSLLKAKGENNG